MREKAKYLLGICIGTSSAKVLLTSVEGKYKKSSEKKYNIEHPLPNWAEQKPETWFSSTIEAIREVVGKSKIDPKNIIGIGLSGQMHSTVFLDENNNVIRPSILWNDQRTANECQYLLDVIGKEEILKYTSNRPINSFSLPKILWVKNNEPDNFKRLKKICLSKDYIKFMLSGVMSTDGSDASGTLCFDVKNGKWSNDLLAELDLDLSLMPEIRPSDEFSATLSKKMSEILNLPSGIPILTGVADTAGEMIGNGVTSEGDCLIKLGTGGDLLVYHPKHLINKGYFDLFRFPDGKFYSVQVVLSTAASLKWGLNNIGLDYETSEYEFDRNMSYSDYKRYIDNNKYNLLEKYASEIPPGGEGGLIFLPYLIGERAPYFDPKAKGALIGLNLRTKKNDIIRAILEGTAFAQRNCYEILKNQGLQVRKLVISGGGSRSQVWCQIYADIFNKEIFKLSTEEGPSLGVCMLAAVSAGIYNSLEEASKTFLKIENTYSPNRDNTKKYNELYEIYNSLYGKLKDSFSGINDFIERYAK